MEDNTLKQMWASINAKQDLTLELNRKLLANSVDLSVRSLLNTMKPIKYFALAIGILWVICVDTIIINTYEFASPFFIVSAFIQVLLTKLAIGIYVYQLITIAHVDVTEPVLSTQDKLAKLKASTLWVTKLLFLQLPVWSTFYLHQGMFTLDNTLLLLIQAMCTGALSYLAIWLFINIDIKNKEKSWFKWIFDGKEWNPVIKSMEMIEEIKAYKLEM